MALIPHEHLHDTFGPFSEMRRWMRHWFEEPALWSADGAAEAGAFDMYRDDDAKQIVVVASLPGFKKEDIHVTVENGVLSISAERSSEKEEKDAHYYRRERYQGSVTRSMTLPTAVKDAEAKAELKDGELTVRVSIAANGAATQIPISG